MENPKLKILVVDDDPIISDALQVVLQDAGYKVLAVSNGQAALRQIQQGNFQLALVDFRLPDIDGISLLEEMKQASPRMEVILITAHGSIDLAIAAIKKGAYYFLPKPFAPDEAIILTQKALLWREVINENEALRHTLLKEEKTFGIVGRNRQMQNIYDIILATAMSDAPVLIEGESGTGKELIANAFHQQSGRAAQPLIRINCAAIPHDLIESEMFGFKRGAFTGADNDKRGLIEMAGNGTLFLDEISEMPLYVQSKLLRVLQDKTIRRLGDVKETVVDFRLIAATNRAAQAAIQSGHLREDLYFRISTIRIQVPPLRERLDDLELLAEYFLGRYAAKYRKPVGAISPEAYQCFGRYKWPGNVRELESAIERAVLFCRTNQITPNDIPEHIPHSVNSHSKCQFPPYITLEEVIKEAILQTLERNHGNVKKTAAMLKLHRPTLYRKLKKYGIRVEKLVE
ncbi:MAG: sigma-54-dependent Fis family transcriptional regulator [Acidobacteria bacterium]|nr:sigma-54-dependent Fis family transcriptional regulator [Acidobacteriota bacterium]MBI3658136.1 sigma-54-dependent Fis family transcriptional regulator [Acidobacteriota bacterium]